MAATQPHSGKPRKNHRARSADAEVRLCAEVDNFVQSIATDLQTLCGLEISSRTDAAARYHWTLEQRRWVLWRDESCWSVWETDG